jgi:hypothetical protein
MKSPASKRPPLVEVTWRDAWVDTEEVEREKVLAEYHPVERHASGYLVHPLTDEQEQAERALGPMGRMILAQDYDAPDGFATVTVIPIGMVTAVRRRRVRRAKA